MVLEEPSKEGETPVIEIRVIKRLNEYGETREILLENNVDHHIRLNTS